MAEKIDLKTIEKKLYTTNEYGVRYQDPQARLSEEDIAYMAKVHKIKTDVHRTCINCQSRQILKYEKAMDKDGKSLKDFRVPCSYIANALPAGSTGVINSLMADKGLSKERATLVLRATQDPAAWSELMFGFDDATKGTPSEFYIRDYQKEQLRCSSRRIVIREGRRSGKALAIDTAIPTPDGWTTMGQLQVGDRVFDENGRACNVTFVTEIMYDHECYEIVFSDGSTIIADKDHSWSVQTKSMRKSNVRNKNKQHGLITLTTGEMLSAVKVGMKHESNYSIPVAGPLEYVKEDIPLLVEPYLLGYWLGDGVRNTGRITIGLEDQEESCRNIENLGYKMRKGGFSKIDCNVYKLQPKLRTIGVIENKFIPLQYLRASVNQRLELLKGLMDADGSAMENGTCEFMSCDPELADGVFELIIGLGFKASKSVGESWFDGERYKDRMRIYFNPAVNVFRLTRKAARIQEKSFSQNNRYITAITKVDSVPVKCITVDSSNHLYLAGRQCVPTHNTFVMALRLIYLAFTMRIARGNSDGTERSTGPQILIITPYQAQVTNIFEEIESLLTRSPDLAKEVTSGTNGNLYVKTPFLRMEFSNGAKISGFVSGVGTKTDGSAGGTLRGQNADIIYLDEMDMIPDEVLQKVVLPIMATRAGTSMIATSTPIGKRSTFYKWSLSDPTFKEDHLPSTVLPQWNEIKDLLIGDSTAESFAAEYMATFIEGGFGVFKPSQVWEARRDYSYDFTIQESYLKKELHIQRPELMLKCIGIDWNKNAGSEFCVVGFDIDQGVWMVLEATNVSASEFSSIRWKEEVIRLNYKWKPDYIYADEGYGHTIIEDLKLMAHKIRGAPKPTLQHVETAKLVDRLVSYNFSSKVELRSPIDGTIISKSGKDFLVEQAIRVFEDGKIWFPTHDEQLRKELMNYVVLRRTPTTNKPIYGPENHNIGDHRLDAFMLGVGGLYLEHSEYSSSAMAMGSPGFLSKAQLEERAPVTEAGGASQIPGLKKTSKVGDMLMHIQRGSPGDGTPNIGGEPRGPKVGRRGGTPQGTSVADYFGELKGRKGIDGDEEHLYQPAVAPMIGERRVRPTTRESRRNWLRR